MDDVALVRERTDIIKLLSEYITLKKAGRNFKANCPFHNENTPSFMVSPDRGMWHCFGCGKGGDAYTFLMEYEHMEFPEALRFLAKRAGITLHEGPINSALISTKEKFYEMNKHAASFYHYLLLSHAVGKKALVYLETRGVKKGTLETFRIGYAPASGNSLVRYLLKKGYTPDEIFENGLGTRRMGRMVDFFSGRLMFPLIDHRDNIVGFSGRILTDDPNAPKYINTKETPIYHKGQQFFGISIGKDAMRKQEDALLVEGEFDVISCFQEGIGNVLAIKGTALTRDQVALLGRYVKKVILAFDDDSAGQEALVRSLALLEEADLTTSVLKIPGGKDPDEAIRQNPYEFKQALKHDIPVYDYLLEKRTAGDMESAVKKKELGAFFLPLFANIKNEIIKEHYLKKLSVLLDTSYESLVHEMGRHVVPRAERSVKDVIKERKSREESLEEYLLALLVQSGKTSTNGKHIFQILEKVLPRERASEKVLHYLRTYFQESSTYQEDRFVGSLPTELLPTFNTAMLYPLGNFSEDGSIDSEITHVGSELLELLTKKKLKILSLAIEEAEANGESSQALQDEYAETLGILKKK